MDNYNSADISAFKDVWVFCEQREGVIQQTSFELISEGRRLADELGCKLYALVLGDNIEKEAREFARARFLRHIQQTVIQRLS